MSTNFNDQEQLCQKVAIYIVLRYVVHFKLFFRCKASTTRMKLELVARSILTDTTHCQNDDRSRGHNHW